MYVFTTISLVWTIYLIRKWPGWTSKKIHTKPVELPEWLKKVKQTKRGQMSR